MGVWPVFGGRVPCLGAWPVVGVWPEVGGVACGWGVARGWAWPVVGGVATAKAFPDVKWELKSHFESFTVCSR